MSNILKDYPEIEKYWDYSKNKIDPSTLTKGSKIIVYLKCPDCGNCFKLPVANFIKRKIKCLNCYKRNKLIINNPAIYRIWDKNKNSLDPNKTTIQSKELAYWKCPNCGYEWQSKIYNIRKGECPCCVNRSVIVKGINDIPTIVQGFKLDFKKELNPFVDVSKLRVSSSIQITWKCHCCGFVWNTNLNSRIIKNKEKYELLPCPNCSYEKGIKPKRATPNYNFAILFPELLKEWDPNNNLNPYELLPSSNITVKWICSTNPMHKWEDSVKNRTIRGFRCKICHPYKQLFYCSFPHLENNFSNKNSFSFYTETKYSNRKAIWNCDYGHEIIRTFSTITSNNGELYCQYCNNTRPLNGYNTLIDLYPDLDMEWDKNNNALLGIYINNVLPSTRTYVWWICPICKKSYLMRIDLKVKMYLRNRKTCKYCTNEQHSVVHYL